MAPAKIQPWRRRFPPTREGWWFLGATLVIGAAAVNGGINLLFLIFGMMLSLIVASGILSELCLRDLAVARRPPASVHAGAVFLMSISVRNQKRRAPTFSLVVEDLLEGKPVDRRCYFLKLPAGRLQETAYQYRLARRGVHRFIGFRVSTRFPFGFIRKSRDLEASADLLVYPALVPVPEPLLKLATPEIGRQSLPVRSRSGDFHGLRDFRPGDDPRDIHWRTTARRGRPLVREFEDDAGWTLMVVLEDQIDGAAWSETATAAYEGAVSLAASLALALLRKGLAVGLETSQGVVPPASGTAQATQILRRLAVIEPTPRAAERPPAGFARARGLAVVTVTPGVSTPRFEAAARAAAASAPRGCAPSPDVRNPARTSGEG